MAGPLQRLLRTAGWDADAVRDDVRAYVAEQLGRAIEIDVPGSRPELTSGD
ncbi:hypothetical protein FHR32_002196 [Streptosporangium album]|uniref:Uncharacterized protein n=1 Tax=Streptosporangium album TaxID=47479 RepID=A0A7W7W8K3_9ACTN|nr:hypothetical protein [Streptosporangium album]MBB4937891.1 hypothetical protein [Streptosporangium album]